MEFVGSVLSLGRRAVAGIVREATATPEAKALRTADRLDKSMPRFVPGRAALMGYDIRFADARSLHSQWNEIFVRGGLKFTALSAMPRILDCGANIGLASLYFKRLYPQARITAYEADPDVSAILKTNLSSNGAGDVEVVDAAVWTHSGDVEFRCEGADSGSIASVRTGVEGAVRRVRALRLRDVLAAGDVDFLKLDIEGGEADVIPDCAGVLRRVRAIVAELHEFDDAARRTPAILEFLAAEGFDYAVTDFCPMPWRGHIAGADTPFGGSAMSWAYTIRAWQGSRT
jgi:FkbM family methyltransferase